MRNFGYKRLVGSCGLSTNAPAKSQEQFTGNKSARRNGSILRKTTKTLGLATAIYAASHGAVSFKDMHSYVSNEENLMAYVEKTSGLSRVSASLGQIDPTITGSIPTKKADQSGLRSVHPDLVQVSMAEDKPLEEGEFRVNRKLKGDRVVSANIKRPPAHFSAGSVLKRHSLFSPLDVDKKTSMAFVKPKSSSEAFKVASMFHMDAEKDGKELEHLPVMVASLVKESENSILSYSKEDDVQHSPFAAVFKKQEPAENVPKLNKYDHSWADDPLPKASFSQKQQDCLARGIYFEARGEPVRGQAAVAQVILNRVRNPEYPNTICGVVYQNKHKRNRCQFSFACDRIRDRVRNPKLWQMAKHVAEETTAGRIWLSEVGSSTHYHATYVRPKWARSMKKLGKIGLHVFYRTKGGGWS